MSVKIPKIHNISEYYWLFLQLITAIVNLSDHSQHGDFILINIAINNKLLLPNLLGNVHNMLE